ncbi:ABC transporter substrate-binding protein [Halobacteriovorax sp. GFR7]|uniref:ABC transporter substrate-binding protein n=1 Tax=unclassified Halobacteriovorax TaxID=2639665 RepID=UPI003D97BC45
MFNTAMVKTLKVSLFPIHSKIDHTHIVSAGEYIVLDHLLRKLVFVNKHGDIVSDLAQSWDVDHSKNEVKFTILKNQKFSNGETITTDKIVASFLEQQKKKSATHFDFTSVSAIKKLNEESIVISLTTKVNIDFFTSLSQPEFGIAYNVEKLNDYSITSGAYFLKSTNKAQFTLERNIHYPSNGKVNQLIINRSGLDKNTFNNLKSGELDFYIPYAGVEPCVLDIIEKDTKLTLTKPNIGFTYWLSLNPMLIGDADRYLLNKVITSCMDTKDISTGGWSRARQLVFENSFGQMSTAEVSELFKKEAMSKASMKEVTFLSFKDFAFNDLIVDCLNSTGAKVKISFYQDQKELSELIKKNDYQIVLNNNDFASINVLKNFKVAFNQARPLFFLGEFKEKCNELVELGYLEIEKNKREQKIVELQKVVIGNSLAIPLTYKRVNYIHNSEMSLKQWPMNFPYINFDRI